MCPVKYGLEGIRQRNYRVWVYNEQLGSTLVVVAGHLSDMFEHLDAFEWSDAKNDLDLALYQFHQAGEFRKDSIELNVADGDSVEGNEVGKIVFGKNCSFAAELINATPDNLTALEALDGTETLIIFEELTGRVGLTSDNLSLSNDLHELIFIMNCAGIRQGLTEGIGKNLSVSEKLTGSVIPIAMLSIEDMNANGASGFRTILDLPYSIADTLAIAEDSHTAETIIISDETSPMVIANGYYVDVSTHANFSDFVTGSNGNVYNRFLINSEDRLFTITGLTTVTTYYIRAWRAVNGVYATSVSTAVESKTN